MFQLRQVLARMRQSDSDRGIAPMGSCHVYAILAAPITFRRALLSVLSLSNFTFPDLPKITTSRPVSTNLSIVAAISALGLLDRNSSNDVGDSQGPYSLIFRIASISPVRRVPSGPLLDFGMSLSLNLKLNQ